MPGPVGESGGRIEYEFISHLEGMGVHLFAVTIHRRQTHYHSDFELFTPVEGSVQVILAGKRQLVRRGEFFFVNAFEAHSLSAAREENLLLVLQASPHFSRAYYPQFASLRLAQRYITRSWAPRLHEELRLGLLEALGSIGRREAGYPLALFAALNRIACAIVRHGIRQPPSARSPGRAERSRTRAVRIAEYIHERYANRPSLEELAAREGLEPSYLSHLIRNSFGISFRDYVRRLRLERAVQMILSTDMPLIDICMETGFSDSRYLHRAVLSEYGVSPGQLREEGREGLLEGRRAAPLLPGGEHEVMNVEAVYGRLVERLAFPAAEIQ